MRKRTNRMKIPIATACAMLLLVAPGRSSAQTTEAWLDYFANWTTQSDWSYEVNPGIAKAVSGAQWLEAYLGLNTTFKPYNWFSTFGKHFNLFYPLVSARLEQRHFWYQSSGTEDTKWRLRLRAFVRFTLNNETLDPGTYYLLFLVEGFTPLDGDAREVSADRTRFQAGLGYVFSPELRLELQYIHMRTLNTAADKYEASSNIVWLAVKHFL